MGKAESPGDIDAYILSSPEETRTRLEQLRDIIQKAAPDAVEKISWGMPTFYLNGNLVHFAAHKNHIGLYPGGGITSLDEFAADLAPYSCSKGAIRLPNDRPIPAELVEKIVRYRVMENQK